MCCAVAILFAFGPRAAILVWWLIEPIRWGAAFALFLWPFLGFLVLPWTTRTVRRRLPRRDQRVDWVLAGDRRRVRPLRLGSADTATEAASSATTRRLASPRTPRSVPRPFRSPGGPAPHPTGWPPPSMARERLRRSARPNAARPTMPSRERLRMSAALPVSSSTTAVTPTVTAATPARIRRGVLGQSRRHRIRCRRTGHRHHRPIADGTPRTTASPRATTPKTRPKR